MVLASIEESIDQERSVFIHKAAEVLEIDLGEVEKVGLMEAKRLWVEKATQDIIDELDSHTTVAGMMEVFGGRIDEDPTPDLLAEIDRRKEELPRLLQRVTQNWAFTQIAYGIDTLIGRSGGPSEIKQRIHEQYQALLKGENLKAFFAIQSREVRSISILLQEPSESPSVIDQSPAVTSKKQRRGTLIPLACDQSTFLNIVECLCEGELLYSAEVGNPRSAFFAHFSFQGAHEVKSTLDDLPKITWRGTLGELIGFFEWLISNEHMSESEGKRSSSLISKHFLREGSPIDRNVVNSTKSIVGSNYGKLGQWRKRIEDLMRYPAT